MLAENIFRKPTRQRLFYHPDDFGLKMAHPKVVVLFYTCYGAFLCNVFVCTHCVCALWLKWDTNNIGEPSLCG